MIRGFLKENSLTVPNTTLFYTVYFILFLLFDLDLKIFLIGFFLSLIFLFFIFAYCFLNYKKKTESIANLIEENKELKSLIEDSNTKQKDLEEYFLLWIHQIKSPITAGNLLLEEHEVKVDELKKQFLSIENYSSMAMNYIKVSNPDTDMDFSLVNLDHIIVPLLKKYSIEFIRKKINLHYTKINEKVLTDGKLCAILIEQILNNALKYTKNGDIWIDYDEKEQALSIRDNGIGISSDNLPKIFDKGYSGFNGKLEQKSSGIGLYLAKKIASRLKHQIQVKSELKEGSRFTILFSNKNNPQPF